MKNILLLIILCLLSQTLSAQKLIRLTGSYTYKAPTTMNIEQAKINALFEAKKEALGREFGYTVSSESTLQQKSVGSEDAQEYFNQVIISEVKGEWIETIGEPIFSKPKFEDNIIYIDVKVTGMAREIKALNTTFDARILRNGTENKFEQYEFRNNDDMFLSFVSPINGFLAVYYIDNDRKVYCILPYISSNSSNAQKIEAGKKYIFFSQKHAPNESVDEYILTANEEVEYNQIYILFSPNKFSKANYILNKDNSLQESEYKSFHEWLSRCRIDDTSMQVKLFNLVIEE
ncbi:MAG: DUF4384 domain-containing protein [Rikenellaceae bacterium]